MKSDFPRAWEMVKSSCFLKSQIVVEVRKTLRCAWSGAVGRHQVLFLRHQALDTKYLRKGEFLTGLKLAK